MTEIGELSVEDELRDELRRVRHDLEHVTAERDLGLERIRHLEFEHRRHQWESTSPPIRRVQERLFDALITVSPEESVRDGWHRAECDNCNWYTTGAESVVEDAGHEHVSNVHMALFAEVLVPVIGSAAAERINELESSIQAVLDYVAKLECTNCEHVHDEGVCGTAFSGGGTCRCDWGPPAVADDIRDLLKEQP